MASCAPLRAPLRPHFHIILTLVIFCAHLTFRCLPPCAMPQCSPRCPHAFTTHFCTFWCIFCPGNPFERLAHLHTVHRAHSKSRLPLFALVCSRTAQKLLFTFLHKERVCPACTVLARTKNGEHSVIYVESIHRGTFLATMEPFCSGKLQNLFVVNLTEWWRATPWPRLTGSRNVYYEMLKSRTE
jgi:hypothetical protein